MVLAILKQRQQSKAKLCVKKIKIELHLGISNNGEITL